MPKTEEIRLNMRKVISDAEKPKVISNLWPVFPIFKSWDEKFRATQYKTTQVDVANNRLETERQSESASLSKYADRVFGYFFDFSVCGRLDTHNADNSNRQTKTKRTL